MVDPSVKRTVEASTVTRGREARAQEIFNEISDACKDFFGDATHASTLRWPVGAMRQPSRTRFMGPNGATQRAQFDSTSPSHALELVKLTALMNVTEGRPEITIGLIDGPVAVGHPDLASQNIREIGGKQSGTCARARSAACMHGTFVAGVLCAKRSSAAPAICPNCTLLVRPIFAETDSGNAQAPSATPEELAAAIIDCVEAGARVMNLSVALAHPSCNGEARLDEALNHAARRGVLVVAAAGNQGAIGSSAITRHPWIVPVVACDLRGRPTGESNLGGSIARRGLRAPGDRITSLGTDGEPHTFGGTSVAAPFVTGALALLCSAFPAARGADLRMALLRSDRMERTTVVPPLLQAWTAYHFMAGSHGTR